MQKLPGMPQPQPFEPWPPKIHGPVPLYDATFSDDSLNPDVDNLGIGPLQFGYSELNNYKPTYNFQNDELFLSVRLPATLPTVGEIAPLAAAAPTELTLSQTAGVFATPLPSGFGRTAPFTIQGTFVAPSGPLNATWAVGILARTGGVADLTTNTQVVATLQFIVLSGIASARLNVPKGATNHKPVLLPPQLMYVILGQDPFGDHPAPSPIPFILGLSVDRISGNGTAFLIVEDQTFSISSFPLKDFQENSGFEISAVGTVIANATATDEFVSVHVRNFQIYSTESAFIE